MNLSDDAIGLSLSHDEALVLFEFFARFQDSDRLEFAHVAEYLAVTRIAAQIDKSVAEMFDPDYLQLLAAARARVASTYEGEYPGPKLDAPDV